MFNANRISESYNRIQEAKEEIIKAKSDARNDLVEEIVEREYEKISEAIKSGKYTQEDFERLIETVVTRTHNIEIA